MNKWMNKWEYKYLEITDANYSNTITFLNDWGKEGWEFTGHIEDTTYSVQYLMKRSIP